MFRMGLWRKCNDSDTNLGQICWLRKILFFLIFLSQYLAKSKLINTTTSLPIFKVGTISQFPFGCFFLLCSKNLVWKLKFLLSQKCLVFCLKLFLMRVLLQDTCSVFVTQCWLHNNAQVFHMIIFFLLISRCNMWYCV